jgi:hypothetical protein
VTTDLHRLFGQAGRYKAVLSITFVTDPGASVVTTFNMTFAQDILVAETVQITKQSNLLFCAQRTIINKFAVGGIGTVLLGGLH